MKGRQLYTYVRETRSGTLSLYEALSGTCPSQALRFLCVWGCWLQSLGLEAP